MISGTPPPFMLDPQLARDTTPVGNLALTRVLLNEDFNYPWLILVPRQPALVELIDLDEAGRNLLISEVAAVSQALRTITQCDKLNVAAFGNIVRQLHVHVIARFRSDAAWPNPVWNIVPYRPYEAPARETLIAALRKSLQIGPVRD
jgi:diadenosine tetraphosphate (Ap4A) HIT family hydrolase